MFLIVFDKKKKIPILLTIILLVLCCVTLSFTGYSQVFGGNALKKLPIYSVDTEKKQIAISFDCAWGDDYTNSLLATMEKENVKCTFFMVEFWVKKYPELVKKISDCGHEIGTHSATHPHMSKLTKDAINSELTTSVKEIENLTNKKVKLFRAPFGEYNDNVLDVASSLGLYTIQWDVDSLDWKNLSATEITNRVTKKVKNGSIVLFHNQGLHTAKAIPVIIKLLKAEGYEFVPISELIYADNYYIAPDGRQIKNS